MPLLGAILLVVATDRGSVLVKKSVQRYRPSHNLVLKEKIHSINNEKGGKFGFVSSHSANTFGLAFYLIFVLRFKNKYFALLLLLWAAFVSYGRIYGGLHYPSDIAGGAILGMILAFLIYKLQFYILSNYFHHTKS